MIRNTRLLSISALLLVVASLTFGLSTPVHGQASPIVLSNLNIKATLSQNCTTYITIEADVVNTGHADISSFDMRVDVRSLKFVEGSVDETYVTAQLFDEDRYTVLRLQLAAPISADSSSKLSMKLITEELQQRTVETPTGPMCINHFIYYIRPLNDIQNLTFTALLPAHATLEENAVAPLFPDPTSNFTDGNRMAFVWEVPFLSPGEELAFIVKYQLPTELLAAPEAEMSLIPIAFLGVVVGAAGIFILERVPNTVRKLREKRGTTISVVSSQEKQIMDLLEKKGGSCPQREIYEELDLSQSMASMLLNSMEERGLIKRFRDGRENVIHRIET